MYHSTPKQTQMRLPQSAQPKRNTSGNPFAEPFAEAPADACAESQAAHMTSSPQHTQAGPPGTWPPASFAAQPTMQQGAVVEPDDEDLWDAAGTAPAQPMSIGRQASQQMFECKRGASCESSPMCIAKVPSCLSDCALLQHVLPAWLGLHALQHHWRFS